MLCYIKKHSEKLYVIKFDYLPTLFAGFQLRLVSAADIAGGLKALFQLLFPILLSLVNNNCDCIYCQEDQVEEEVGNPPHLLQDATAGTRNAAEKVKDHKPDITRKYCQQ